MADCPLSKDLVFVLNTEGRQAIFHNLTQFQHLLFVRKNEQIDIDECKKWIDQSKESIDILIKLPLKHDEANGEGEQGPQRKRTKTNSTTLQYDLSHDLRMRILDFLLTRGLFLNYNFKPEIDLQTKNELVEETRNLISSITKLKYNVVEMDELIHEDLHPSTSFITTDQQNINPDIDANLPTIVFDVEFVDVESIFKKNKEMHSDFSYCNGIPFFLCVRPFTRKNGTKFLDVLLCIQNHILKSNWSCKCWFSIILVSQERSLDRTEGFEHTFDDNYGFGDNAFISMEDLYDAKNGFLSDGNIKFRVHLTAEKLVFGD